MRGVMQGEERDQGVPLGPGGPLHEVGFTPALPNPAKPERPGRRDAMLE
jgi:hypothetical protein